MHREAVKEICLLSGEVGASSAWTLSLGKGTWGPRYILFLASRGFVVQGILYPLHNCKPKGSSNSRVEFGFALKEDAPLARFLCIQRRQESILFMPRRAAFHCFPGRILPSFIVLQTTRCVGGSGNGKTALRVLNNEASPQIYMHMPSTH